jgi:hypothetical protein
MPAFVSLSIIMYVDYLSMAGQGTAQSLDQAWGNETESLTGFSADWI